MTEKRGYGIGQHLTTDPFRYKWKDFASQLAFRVYDSERSDVESGKSLTEDEAKQILIDEWNEEVGEESVEEAGGFGLHKDVLWYFDYKLLEFRGGDLETMRKKQAKEELEYLDENTDAEEIIEITEDEEGLEEGQEKPDEKIKDEKDLEDVFYNTSDIASPTALETDEDVGDMPEIEPLGGPSPKPFDVPDVEESMGDMQTAYEMIQDSIAGESDAGQEYVEIGQQLEREKQPENLRKTIEEIADDEREHREELKEIADEMEGTSESEKKDEKKKSESKPKEEKKDDKKEEKGEKKEANLNESYELGKEYSSDKVLLDAKMAWKIAYTCEDIGVADKEEFVKGFEEGRNK